MSNASGAITLDASKIITTFDIDKPEVRAQFFRIRGNQGMNFFAILESLGYDRAVTQNKSRQYEEDWIHQTIHLGNSMSATGNPNEFTFQLSSVAPNIDYLQQNVTSPYDTTAQYVFPVKIWDIITLPENNAKLQVTNKVIAGSTCTITAKHMNPTTGPFTLGNYVAGVELIVTGNAFSEGSDQSEGQVNKPLIDYSYTQIIKSTFTQTGSQMVSQPWFTEYSDGRGIKAYYIVGQNNTEYEHALSIDAALLFGALTEISIVDSATAEPIQTTEGIDPYIKRKGNNIPYVPGTFSVSLFDYMDKLLEQEGAPAYMGAFLGTDLDNEKDNVLKAYFQNNNMTEYNMKRAEADLFGNNPGLAMQVNFKYLHKGYRTWCFTRMPQFNMAKLWGAAGYNTQKLGLFWPLASKPDPNNPTNRIPYMGMIHRALGGYSRKSEVFSLLGAGPGSKVTSRDVNKLVMRSDIGAEHCGGNQMIRLYQA
jgi:hypothetical protein